MTRKAVRDSLRPALLVLMMAAVSGCGQPTTVRHYTTQLFTRSPEPVLAEHDHPGLPDHEALETASQDGFGGLADEPTSPEYAHALERMSASFQLPEVRHARLDRQIAWYQRNAGSLKRALDRANPFIAWILDQIEANNLPAELALLPVIESGYQPSALSPSSAAGLWQFIPSTGSRFGLKQNGWYDGRRDVVDSTQAAMEYLTYLRDEFDGDWLLALAAYNAGEGAVARAVRRNRDRELPTDFWNLELPAQTQEYVAKLLALRDIVATPGHYGIDLPEPDATTQIALIETGNRMDLGQAADMAGISLADVQKLNPGLRKATTPPQGPHRLVVPLAVADRFAAHLADLSDDSEAMPQQTTLTQKETVAATAPARIGTVHRVRSGETLWSLARRYGLTVAQLADQNGLAQSAALRAGQTLRVEGGKRSTAARTAVAATQTDASGDRQSLEYTVKPGDSLIQISRRYRVTLADLRKWNGLSREDYLQPGQKLTLYLDTSLRAEGSGG